MIKAESMLSSKPDEITRFSHVVVRIFCPVVFKMFLSLAHVAFTKGTAANCIELASAIIYLYTIIHKGFPSL